MFIGVGLPIPELANLPGVSRPGKPGGGSSTPSVDQIANQYSFKFDRAAGTYMPTGINIATDSNFSVSFWVKGNISAAVNPGIFPFSIASSGGNSGGANSTIGRMHLSGGVAKFMIQSRDNTNVSNTFGNRVININIYDGNWYHIVFTRDNTSGQVFAYVNGVNVQWTGVFSSSSAPSITLNPSGNLHFGSAWDAIQKNFSSYAWDGWLDEFALFDRVLQEDDIKAIYDATTAGMTADLSTLSTGAPTAWYRMGD